MFESEIGFIGKITVFALTIIVGVIVILSVVSWSIQNQDAFQDTVAHTCGLDEKLRSIITFELLTSLPENTPQQKEIKQTLTKIAWEQKVTFDEYQTVLDILDIAEKRRLGLMDLEKVCYLFRF